MNLNLILSFNLLYFILIDRAENYLSEIFYDLTTVALHDWHNNGVMRTLAKYKFNLETIDDKLPNHTLEQVS